MKIKATLVVVGLILSGCSFDTSKFVPEFLQKSAGHSTKQYAIKINKKAKNSVKRSINKVNTRLPLSLFCIAWTGTFFNNSSILIPSFMME